MTGYVVGAGSGYVVGAGLDSALKVVLVALAVAAWRTAAPVRPDPAATAQYAALRTQWERVRDQVFPALAAN